MRPESRIGSDRSALAALGAAMCLRGGNELRATGGFNCLGTELLQECKEIVKATVKTLSPTLGSHGPSRRRCVGQTHKLYSWHINAEM